MTTDIDVGSPTGVPATKVEVEGGGGGGCRGELPELTSSYSALTRATASKL